MATSIGDDINAATRISLPPFPPPTLPHPLTYTLSAYPTSSPSTQPLNLLSANTSNPAPSPRRPYKTCTSPNSSAQKHWQGISPSSYHPSTRHPTSPLYPDSAPSNNTSKKT
ncbi:MAG: hypothetical protein LQ352_008250 [Teloschistes flavicans]|nr:MAG: hypothetical protein LQ352_008250 [Teloschistes flavicans]